MPRKVITETSLFRTSTLNVQDRINVADFFRTEGQIFGCLQVVFQMINRGGPDDDTGDNWIT